MKKIFSLLLIWVFMAVCFLFQSGAAQSVMENSELDARVKKFLERHKGQWHDWNVPAADGKLLHDIILKNRYTKALEIGTSTGHSAIWIAWALSKTGGKLITIEIDSGRYHQALQNFEEAGLSGYIDARLADAHKLVKELEGPFDFVFQDADKDWYTNYFTDIYPKLETGGCFTAHNALMRSRGIREYLDYIKKVPGLESTINTDSGAGVAISYKKSKE